MGFWNHTFWLACAILMAGCLIENQMPEPDWMVDQADVLDVEDENALVNLLSDFYDSTSVTLAGLTLASLRGESIESYAASVYSFWELGSAETHNGILVTLLEDERLVHITVGSGMAQQFPVHVRDSIQVAMAQRFGLGDYYDGFELGFEQLMRRASAVPWRIAYTSIFEAKRDSLHSMDKILSAEGVITGFEEDLVLLADSDGKEIQLMIPAEAPILSVEDVIGFTGRIVEIQPIRVQVLNLDADYTF